MNAWGNLIAVSEQDDCLDVTLARILKEANLIIGSRLRTQANESRLQMLRKIKDLENTFAKASKLTYEIEEQARIYSEAQEDDDA